MTEIISAKDNPLIKRITKLMSSAKARRQEGCFVCEGIRLCMDALLSGVELLCFCCTEGAYKKYNEDAHKLEKAAKRSVMISPELFGRISDTETPQGFLCIGAMKENAPQVIPGECYVGLERIQDPSNLGTILRTAEALGAGGVILSRDCCDIYSPKVIRGSMGAVFRLPVLIVEELTDYITDVGKRGICTYASTPRAAVSIDKADLSAGGIMLIGNEGNGLDEDTVNACTMRVMIPMRGRAESLNAAAAASILMYELMRSQGQTG